MSGIGSISGSQPLPGASARRGQAEEEEDVFAIVQLDADNNPDVVIMSTAGTAQGREAAARLDELLDGDAALERAFADAVVEMADVAEGTEVVAVGTSLDRVVDLIRFSEIRLGWDLWFYLHQEVSVLFDDGTGYAGLDVPLESFDRELASASTPERFFVWRTNEEGLRELRREVDGDGEWSLLKGRSMIDRSDSPQTLDQSVTSTETSGIWNMGGTMRTSGYTFFSSGRFVRFFSLMHEGGEGEGDSRVSVHQDAGGVQFAAQVGTREGPGDTVGGAQSESITTLGRSPDGDMPTKADPELQGEYEIRGNTLVLRYDDGREVRQLFARFGDGGLMIGDRLHA